MVRELSALFQVLRKKEKELRGFDESTPMHASLKFDFLARKQSRDYGSEPQVSDDEGKTYKLISQHYIVDFYDAFRYVLIMLHCTFSNIRGSNCLFVGTLFLFFV
jgi:hypothetical protein